MDKEFDYFLKIVIVGDSQVGKSSLFIRFADDEFKPQYIPTIGVDFKVKKIIIENKNVKLQLWDTAGQERFRNLIYPYYRNAEGLVLVYDITDGQSFKNIKYWQQLVRESAADVPILVIGTKNDQEGKRQVDTEQACKYCQENNLLFYECSAKTSYKIEQAIIQLSRLMIQRKDEQVEKLQKKKEVEQNPLNEQEAQPQDEISQIKQENKALKEEVQQLRQQVENLTEQFEGQLTYFNSRLEIVEKYIKNSQMNKE